MSSCCKQHKLIWGAGEAVPYEEFNIAQCFFVYLPSTGQGGSAMSFLKRLPSDVRNKSSCQCLSWNVLLISLHSFYSSASSLSSHAIGWCMCTEPFFQPGTLLSSVPCCSSQASVWRQLHKLWFGICPLIFKPFHHKLGNPGKCLECLCLLHALRYFHRSDLLSFPWKETGRRKFLISRWEVCYEREPFGAWLCSELSLLCAIQQRVESSGEAKIRELVREISQWNLQLWITSACELIAQQCIIIHFGRSWDKPRAAEIWAEYWCWTCN